jgi:pyridoxal/pyridoxine/pyridoxamine kinase
VTAADSERQQEPSITQALHVINGDTINKKLRAPRALIDSLLAGTGDNTAAVERLYLAALSRLPTDEELRTLTKAMDETLARDSAGAESGSSASSPRRRVLEDLAWAILTSTEFLFNH